jgi:hypothetical protein
MKIRLVHLLLEDDIDDKRQDVSISHLKRLERMGIEYIQIWNKIYQGDVELENWLSYVQRGKTDVKKSYYGNYSSFKNALLDYFNNDVDIFIMCEGDAILTVSEKKIMDSIKKAHDISHKYDLKCFSFGNRYNLSNGVKESYTFFKDNDIHIVDDIIGAQMLLFFKKDREYLRDIFNSKLWNGIDLFFNYFLRGKFGIFDEPLTTQFDGYSVVDGQNKKFIDVKKEKTYEVNEKPSKEKGIVIIGSYADTLEKLDTLNECIDKISKLGDDILLVSHKPVPVEIQSKVHFYIYDKDNTLLPYEKSPFYYFINEDMEFKVECNYHALTITRNMFNSINFAKIYNYDFFLYMESDVLFAENDIKKLRDKKEEFLNSGKQMLFFSKEEDYPFFDRNIYYTILFGGRPKQFLENVNLPTTVEDYYNFQYTLEDIFHDILCEKKDNVFLIETDLQKYFNESSINKNEKKYFSSILIDESDKIFIFVINFDKEEILINLNGEFKLNLIQNSWYMINIEYDTINILSVYNNSFKRNEQYIVSEKEKDFYKRKALINYKK